MSSVCDATDCGALIDDWRATFEGSLTDLSVSPEWTLHAARSAGLGDRLRMLGLRDANGRLTGAAAYVELRERFWGVPLRVRELPGNKLVSYHHELMGADGPALLDALVRADGRMCDLLYLPTVPRDSITDMAVVEHARRRGWSLVRLPGNRSPFVPISGTWDQFLAGKSSNFRYTLKRKRKALEGLGAVEERWYRDPSTVDELLACIAQIESSSWKAGAGMSITGSAQEKAYYELLLPWLAAKGALCANAIFVDGAPAAYSLSYEWNGRVAQMKTSFDERFSSVSAGLVVNSTAIRQAFESGAREFDFLGDVMPHKTHWCSQLRAHDHLFVFTSTLRGRLIGALKRRLYAWRPRGAPVTTGRGERMQPPAADGTA